MGGLTVRTYKTDQLRSRPTKYTRWRRQVAPQSVAPFRRPRDTDRVAPAADPKAPPEDKMDLATSSDDVPPTIPDQTFQEEDISDTP